MPFYMSYNSDYVGPPSTGGMVAYGVAGGVVGGLMGGGSRHKDHAKGEGQKAQEQ